MTPSEMRKPMSTRRVSAGMKKPIRMIDSMKMTAKMMPYGSTPAEAAIDVNLSVSVSRNIGYFFRSMRKNFRSPSAWNPLRILKLVRISLPKSLL